MRAANNGISAGIDAKGRLIDAIGLDSIATVDITMNLEKSEMRGGTQMLNTLFILLAFGLFSVSLALYGRFRAN